MQYPLSEKYNTRELMAKIMGPNHDGKKPSIHSELCSQ